MFRPLKLLAPALIPSWNFFDVVAPSPRIEYALLESPQDAVEETRWRAFRPKPDHVGPGEMLRRLFWNPVWNETLFMVSCAERLVDEPTAHSEDEIFTRLAADLERRREIDLARFLTFRLVFVSRQGEALAREVLHQATPRLRAEIPRR
jgi:hypothetical protein